MEKNLKKHILNNFSNKNVDVAGPTGITETVESTDVDEFVLAGPTRITHAIEESDPDEFSVSGAISVTKAIELSYQDEMGVISTEHVPAMEISDDDEFLFI